jgi:uncharacterized protein YjiS (DUF1127 family)
MLMNYRVPTTAAESCVRMIAAIATPVSLWVKQLYKDKNRRALAELEDDQLSNLSDIGRQVRREARRERATGC